ncbi:MAG: right-handed parallel beta-helix repeat-containing protein [Planctomycetes bacterium]|nr:right-handed parallel beta-helix repeat-containing protein [Planctomycetota bacterium]
MIKLGFLLALAAAGLCRLAAQEREVTESLVLEQGAVLATPLVIRTGGITIDGNGATLQGPGRPGEKASFTAAGITAAGISRVTLRNLRVRGFERGLDVRDGEGWRIENCDFSDNYHDPEYGWGEHGRAGGLVFTRMHRCTITGTRACRVWNGLDLLESHENVLEKNDFSRCSNVCLKLWTSCRNRVIGNDLSWGLRIRPGEVHARDSACVLLESGSDGNHFERNDITHGGDGVFIRVLNGWVSTGNVFVENDCSHANNNGLEAWSPGNTYLRNRANHCSFGFWLGGSDRTVLVGNEAAYNGRPDGPHHAPEPDFVHGGIVIVHGSGSHTVIDSNHCHHNYGAGIVFRGDLATRGAKWKMFHLVVQRNRLEHNRWGVFARFTDWVDLAANTFAGNKKDEFLEEVTAVFRRPADPEGGEPPEAALTGPTVVTVGETAVFDASASRDATGRPLAFRWDLGGTVRTEAVVKHAFSEPGFHRVGLTVHNGHLADLASLDCYAVERVAEIATEGHAAKWGWSMGHNTDGRGRVQLTDDPLALVGKSSVRFRPDPYPGHDVAAIFPAADDGGWDLTHKTALDFWLRFRNPNNHGFQGTNPIVRLHAGTAVRTYTPAYRGQRRNLLGDLPYSEARGGWLRVSIPLAGSDEWLRADDAAGAPASPPDGDAGFAVRQVERLSLQFDSFGYEPFDIWIDGLAFR